MELVESENLETFFFSNGNHISFIIIRDFIKQLVVERSERLGQRKGQVGVFYYLLILIDY